MAQRINSIRTYMLPSGALVGFFVLTFAITWSVIGIFIVLPEWASATFGSIDGSHPLFFLATWAPAIAAFVLVAFFAGFAGLKAFLSRLLLWQCPWGWAAFVFVGIPLVFVAGSLLKGGTVLAPIGPGELGQYIAVTFMMLFLGPIEEFGWRGFAQPLLQRHMAPLWAGMLIGAVWGIWHVPAFFLSGTVFTDWNFLPFFVGNVALAVLVTPLFNRARGSLLWPMLFHWQLIIPFWPDAQPYDTILLAAIAVIVVWWNRDTMLERTGSVTEIVPREGSAVR